MADAKGKTAAPAAKPKRVRVRARRTGYVNDQRYRAGDVFVYGLTEREEKASRERRRASGDDDNDGLPTWLEAVPASTPERVTTGQAVVDQENAEVRARVAGGDTGEVI